jgi:hypothetical protein
MCLTELVLCPDQPRIKHGVVPAQLLVIRAPHRAPAPLNSNAEAGAPQLPEERLPGQDLDSALRGSGLAFKGDDDRNSAKAGMFCAGASAAISFFK